MSLELLGNTYPQEWTETFLPEICNPKQWKTISTSELTETGYVVYGANGKIGFYSTYTHEKPTLMITCRGATCGNLHISVPFAYINGNAMALDELPENLITQKYLYYALKARGLDDAISGSAQPQITRQGLSVVNLRIAPLAEQQQIAQKLDELLAQVDTLKTRLDAIPNILKRFRQSVLAAAVSGRLTEGWRGVNELAAPTDKALKEMIIALDQGWSPKCLSEVGADDDWAVIKTSSVQKVNFVKEENKKLPASFEARPELSLKKGDVLITRAGPRVRCGVTCLVKKDHPKLMICDKVYRIRTNSEVLMPEYLNFLFNSPQYLEVIEELKTGSSESGMNMTMKKLVEIILPTPCVVEQLEIIKLVEQLFAYADQIEQRVKDAQARVNHLTQSILAKAFRGELTAEWRAQNPEIISGENSAAALLERIRVEREVVGKAKRKVKA